jgi:hypothetical protein
MDLARIGIALTLLSLLLLTAAGCMLFERQVDDEGKPIVGTAPIEVASKHAGVALGIPWLGMLGGVVTSVVGFARGKKYKQATLAGIRGVDELVAMVTERADKDGTAYLSPDELKGYFAKHQDMEKVRGLVRKLRGKPA